MLPDVYGSVNKDLSRSYCISASPLGIMRDVNGSGTLRGVTGDPAYRRLGEMVEARRTEIIGSRAKAFSASGIGDQTWVDIENGVKRNYSDKTRKGVMRALGWTPESWDLILSGGEPRSAPESTASRLEQLEKRMALLAAAVDTLLARLPGDPPDPPTS